MLCTKFGWKFTHFKIATYFRFFILTSTWKMAWNLSVETWMSFTKRWVVFFQYSNVVNVVMPSRNYLYLKKDIAIHLNKLEFPSSNDALCQVWLKLIVLEEKISSMDFRYIAIIIPWKRGCGPRIFEQSLIPLFCKDALCQVFNNFVNVFFLL